ncbi:hypothetical protein L0337_08175 [candidate division KSB1 bacterium]|nr:hypothetical protein [candidate division KSB1 bacterium]
MISKTVKRILIMLPLLVVVVGLIGFLYWQNPNLIDFSKASDAKLADLRQFDLLKNTFESDSGYVRLITQLSPT